jgi:transposase
LTVVVTNNPELYEAQMVGVLNNIEKCGTALAELKERLRLRREGFITKGKKPTTETVTKNILGILSAEYMKDIFDYTVACEPGLTPTLTFSTNEERLGELQERILGKTVLFTNHSDWSDEQIVSAYRSQYHVEEAFKNMKDTKYLSFRPMRHFTDDNIRVHAFYCVLALTLSSLLNKELEQMGHKMSIRRMFDTFHDAQQVVSIFASSGGEPSTKTEYSRFDGIVKAYADKYNLLEYLT